MYIENSSISRYNAILSFYTKPRKPLCSKEKFVLYLNLMTACNPDISLEFKSSYGLARFDNAIRAEIGFDDEHKDKKVITVKAVNDRTNVYITVKNNISGVEVPRDDNSSLHGYGQQILHDIAGIYSGNFTTIEKDDVYTGILTLKMDTKAENSD